MKELKRTKTIEEVTGYEAFDGKIFSDREECLTYENTAGAVMYKELQGLMIGKGAFAECEIYGNFGYGGEEWELAVIEIKNARDLDIVNRYYEYNCRGNFTIIGSEFIGKRILITLGDPYCRDTNPSPKTMEMLMEQFKEDIEHFFYPENNNKEEN